MSATLTLIGFASFGLSTDFTLHVRPTKANLISNFTPTAKTYRYLASETRVDTYSVAADAMTSLGVKCLTAGLMFELIVLAHPILIHNHASKVSSQRDADVASGASEQSTAVFPNATLASDAFGIRQGAPTSMTANSPVVADS